MDIRIEDIVIANGKILLSKSGGNDDTHIYRVVKVAKNANNITNYEGLGKRIEVGDLVVCLHPSYRYIEINGWKYFVVKPSDIEGYVKQSIQNAEGQ